ncbi:hypothetical protein TWF481_001515 [Arthrobotrys musiformis]|uniref:Uncharacterized protein n=1 Tax=Arthrobotrys musiformis TaxID=47236 RepID=A0AAV9WR09_9PEZI
MPRCHKALNREIHDTILGQKHEISRELELLKQYRDQQSASTAITAWTLEDEKEIERLHKEVQELSGQAVALYNQFVISPERLRNMRVSYRRLSQIWLV